MILYHNTSNTLEQVKEKPFKLERDIQNLFENNLQNIMGLQMVKSEFTIKNKRIDTLAYDKQSNAFIIIEYKRDKNYSVVDQGLTYLNLMLQNKAEFILTYNETLPESLHSKDVDWSQSRVAFVSPSFTENQISASDFKDFGIELWEVKQFENNTISINSIKKSSGALNHQSSAAIQAFDMEGYFTELGLEKHLSPSRGNGLRSIVLAIREQAV